jgi:hypothetical protein
MFSSSRVSVGGLLVCFALLGGAGCKETVSSENIRTPGISMATVVTAGSGSSKVEVTLTVGGDESNTYVVLEEGDQIFALADGDEKEMEEVSEGIYEATFDVNEEDTAFAIHLERENDEDANGSGGRLPAPFMITSDLGDEPYSRTEDDIVITWEPDGSDDDMRIEASDDDRCITTTERFDPAGDSGSYTIAADADDPPLGNNDEDTCEITIDVIREREGTRDANLDPESTFILRQLRSTTAVSAP